MTKKLFFPSFPPILSKEARPNLPFPHPLPLPEPPLNLDLFTHLVLKLKHSIDGSWKPTAIFVQVLLFYLLSTNVIDSFFRRWNSIYACRASCPCSKRFNVSVGSLSLSRDRIRRGRQSHWPRRACLKNVRRRVFGWAHFRNEKRITLFRVGM